MVRIFRGGTPLPDELEGNVILIGPEACAYEGLITGDLFARNRARIELHGNVAGSLFVERTAEVVVRGTIGRNAKVSGGDLKVYGQVNGDVIDAGGTLYVDEGATVRGTIRKAEPPQTG